MTQCPSTNTLSSLFNDSSLSDQTLVFNEEVIHVTKVILATNSDFFRSLWFMDFGDKHENPVDFSHLPVSQSSFVSFIKSIYGSPADITATNVYDFFYLAHYFQVELLVNSLETTLSQNLSDWSWLEKFVMRANQNQDLRALEFCGPFFKKVKNIGTNLVDNLDSDSIKVLTKFCNTNQSQSWLVKSLVSSIKNSTFELFEFSDILRLLTANVLSFKEWDELLLLL
ncbi:hypothetical protein GEMRC1_001113 [Eukaryota sp. GEM-RC1]